MFLAEATRGLSKSLPAGITELTQARLSNVNTTLVHHSTLTQEAFGSLFVTDQFLELTERRTELFN